MAASFLPLPETFTITDDQGANPISFRKPYSRDSQDGQKAMALEEATKVRGVEEVGVTFDYLSSEVRWDFYWDDRILGGRFLEILYSTGFTDGSITAKEASELTGKSESSCLRALKALKLFFDERFVAIRKITGELDLHSGRLSTRESCPDLDANSPQSHKKGMGTGAGRGVKAEKFYVYGKDVLNATHNTASFFPFDMAVLESNKLYTAAIVKQRFVGVSKNVRLGQEAEKLEISRTTLNGWLDALGLDHSVPWTVEKQLTAEEIADLADDGRGMTVRMKQRKQRYGTVKSKDTGEVRQAHKDAIFGNTPSKAHYQRTGEFKTLKPLQGHLVVDKRVGTVVTDTGGFVYRSKRVVYPVKNKDNKQGGAVEAKAASKSGKKVPGVTWQFQEEDLVTIVPTPAEEKLVAGPDRLLHVYAPIVDSLGLRKIT